MDGPMLLESKQTQLMMQNKLVPVRQVKKKAFKASDYTGIAHEPIPITKELSSFRTKQL